MTFDLGFSQRLHVVTLPRILQELFCESCFHNGEATFRHGFFQNLQRSSCPAACRHCLLCHRFNQSLLGVALAIRLRSLFNQSLRGLALPRGLRTGHRPLATAPTRARTRVLATSSTRVQPSSLQTLTFGYRFSRSLHRVRLPTSMRSLTSGFSFNKGWRSVAHGVVSLASR
mgnify:CR=1 FL=1